MTREDRQEALSLAYVKAVAAMCGMTYSTRSKDYGLDLTLYEVSAEGGRFVESGIALDLQLKSTTSIYETGKEFGFDLAVRAYDFLRAETHPQRILVVFILPNDESEWIRQTHGKLELRKAAYWISLRGRPAVKNRSSVRIEIPKRHLFSPAAVREIIGRIRRGEEVT
jgi:hypothetical protein